LLETACNSEYSFSEHPVAGETTALNDADKTLKNRWLLLYGWIAFSSMLFARPLFALIRMSTSNDDASHYLLIPFISAWILFVERRQIFLNLSYNTAVGGSLLVGAACAALVTGLECRASSIGLQLSGYILSLVLLWVAGFSFVFGSAASRAACFPLLFLFLMVPLPRILLGHVTYALQASSAWITGVLFDLLGVPSLREGFVFHLARVNIEIAKECSGIRSSIALLILALLVAHFRLKSFWNKTLFVACGLFMMVLKNGIRIATLTLLAIHIDPSFLIGRLHRQGGIVFFVLALLLLLPVLLLLQRNESGREAAAEPS
jgi:exosortase